jgi:CHAT domain-containing protein
VPDLAPYLSCLPGKLVDETAALRAASISKTFNLAFLRNDTIAMLVCAFLARHFVCQILKMTPCKARKLCRLGCLAALLAFSPRLAMSQGMPGVTGNSRSVGSLRLHQPIDRQLGPGQTDVFTVTMSPGQFLHVVVNQKGVDLVVVVADPEGTPRVTADQPPSRAFGPVPVSLVAEERGKYKIRVQKSLRTTVSGPYRVELTELHTPSAQDRIRLQAESEFYAAVMDERSQDGEKKVRAITAYQRAAVLWHSLHDLGGEALSLTRIGAINRNRGENQAALKNLNDALLLWRAAKDPAGEALTLIGIGLTYSFLGDRHKAVEYCNRALPLERGVGDRGGEALTLQALGNFYWELEENQKSLDANTKALTLRRAMGDRANEANILQGLGLVYRDLGQNQKALDDFHLSLTMCRETGNRYGEAGALNNIGFLYQEIGENQKSLEYFNQALPLYRALGDRPDEATVLYNISYANSELGDVQKALGQNEQALALFRAMDDRPGEAKTLSLEGTFYRKLRENQKALDYLNQALPLLVGVGDQLVKGWTLGAIGDAYSDLGDKEKALQYYVQALQLSRAISNPAMEGGILSDLMAYWQKQQNPALAIFFGKQAVNQFQDVRRGNQGLEEQSQRTFVASINNYYRQLADLLIAQGRLSEAEQVISLLKEQEYFNYVRRDAADVAAANGTASLNAEETAAELGQRQFSDQLMKIGAERGELLMKTSLTGREKQRLEELEKDIAVGNARFEKFLADLAMQFAAKPSMALQVESLRETQGMMEDLRELPPGTIAIVTIVGEDKFRAILRTPNVQKAYEYPITAADLNRKVSAFRQVLMDPHLDPRPMAEELYKILVGPMAEDLRQAHAQTLMWSLDGTLRYLPVSALFDGSQYLVERYRMSVMTLASATRLKDRPDAKRMGVGFGVTRASEDAPALPWVSAELAGIIATKPGDRGALPGEVELDDAFTQRSMRQALLKRYAVVHVASHFRFQPGNDAQSYLLLGNGGHLSLAELRTSASLFGGVQLLTLSACNTGVGDGAEVEGFGTLAQRQGAKAIVASLWPVADISTSLLMQSFYRNWQSSQDMTKLEALREAQLELLHGTGKPGPETSNRGSHLTDQPNADPSSQPFPVDSERPYAHPYYWAPFFLMGNWL